ncbi:hypothetical protein V8C86DRAFT_2518031 [Haematococcus lacustris]
MGDSAPVALAMSAGVALAGGIAALTTLLGRHRQDRGPPLGSDLEYLLRRASALKQQQCQQRQQGLRSPWSTCWQPCRKQELRGS